MDTPPAALPAAGADVRRAGGPHAPAVAIAPWVLAYAGVLCAILWTRSLEPLLLLAVGVAIATALLAAWRAGRRGASPALLPLVLGLGTLMLVLAFSWTSTRELGAISSRWATLVADRRAHLGAVLGSRMASLVERGQNAAAEAARWGDEAVDASLFADLADVQRETGVAAIAVFDSTGSLRAWAGDHRGRLPEEARLDGARIFYAERPLFSYLYFSVPVRATGGHAVAAILLQAGLPARRSEAVGFADRFAALTGARPIFGPGRGNGAAWVLSANGQAVAHADFERMGQAEWRDRVVGSARMMVLLLSGITLLILVVGWLRTRPRIPGWRALPLAAVIVAVVLAPLGATFSGRTLFSPAFFLLPLIPADVSLGKLAAILLPLAALVAAARPRRGRRPHAGIAIAAAAVLVGVAFAGILRLLLSGAAAPLLEAGAPLWGGLQFTAVLALTCVAGVALDLTARRRGDDAPAEHASGASWSLFLGSILASVFLALGLLLRWQMTQHMGTALAALSAIPFAGVALALGRYRGHGLVRWLAAGWLAACAVLPQLWATHVDARLRAAEREVSTLGTRPDPFLDYMLHQFANEVVRRHERGEVGVELLYRSWVASGFAQEAYPARLTLWDSPARPAVQLALGGASADESGAPDSVPGFLRALVRQAAASHGPIVGAIHDVPDVNQAMAVPLGGGRMVSAVVPPRRDFEQETSLAPFLGAVTPGDTHLDLVPVKPGIPPPPPQIVWHATDSGWRSEVAVHFPEGDYHAHVELLLPSVGVRLARAVLLAAADLGVLLLIWLLGRAATGNVLAQRGTIRSILRGFRARLTLALFAFFLLPTIVFGYAAYRALSGEVVHSARVVAQQAVAQAAKDFPAPIGDLRQLSAHTGAELLYFQGGELLSASSVEALELGLYSAWMPPSVYLTLRSGEETGAVETQRLAAHPYLVAYRRLPVAGALAVPEPLAAGDAAVRQRELAHLILFAVLVGALLTFGLSLAVGRALSTPIGQLRRAAALVGNGHFRVRLPEQRRDEFGDVFASFNRMARRLRRARARELRTARVLAWGEMARQVAHEIKNPLTPIKLSVQHLRRAFADGRTDFGPILENNVEQILAEIDRLTEIARAFSRYGAPAGAAGPLEAVNVAAVVRDALTLYSASDRNVAYVQEVDAALPLARARVGELKEVILNVVENARTALDGKGTITVAAHSDGGFIDLVVRDTGPGIPPEQLPQIFEPHFSTRSSGTGLGLAIVRRLVEGWGGAVAAESEPGAGTAIRVRIPAVERLSDEP